MAGKGRRYARDRQGRFFSTGATARGGRLTTAKGKAYSTVRTRGPAAGMTGTIRPGKRSARHPAAANSIRPAKLSKAKVPASQRVIKAGKALPCNAMRRGNRVVDEYGSARGAFETSKLKAGKLIRKMERTAANNALSCSRLDREIERQAGTLGMARSAVQRRQTRAFQVANGRNPRVGSKALFQYQDQLKAIGTPANSRQKFRRKPMTEKQAASAKARRDKANTARLNKALDADLKAARPNRPTAKPKAKRPRKRRGT